jgi:hypothetical protein
VLVVAVGLAIGIVLWNSRAGPDLYRFLPLAGVIAIAALCFRDWFRRDRRAFVWVMGPALVAALICIVLPQPWSSVLGTAAVVFLALFIFETPVPFWWWEHVLRRRPPTPGERYEAQLRAILVEWRKATSRDDATVRLSDRRAAAARSWLARLAGEEPPDADWAAIRDGYLGVGEEWIRLVTGELPAEDGRRLQARLDELRDRRSELLAPEPG